MSTHNVSVAVAWPIIADRAEDESAGGPTDDENGSGVSSVEARVRAGGEQRLHGRAALKQKQLLVEGVIEKPGQGCHGEDKPMVRGKLAPPGEGVVGGSVHGGVRLKLGSDMAK